MPARRGGFRSLCNVAIMGAEVPIVPFPRMMTTVLVVAIGGLPVRAVDPPLADVLARARASVATWQPQLSGLVLEERYVQHLEMRHGGTGTMRLRSDVLLVRVKDAWVGFRDIAEVDGHPIAGRSRRLEDLFVSHPLAEALLQARRISDEGSRYNLGTVYRNFNVPTTPLRLFEPDRAARVTFKLDAMTTRDNRHAAVVSYHEGQPPTLLLTLSEQPIHTSGKLWIDSASGQVLATEMQWRLAPPRDAGDLQAKVAVSYHEAPEVHIFVPAEMTESYQTADEIIDCHAEYTGVRRFTVAVTDDVSMPR